MWKHAILSVLIAVLYLSAEGQTAPADGEVSKSGGTYTTRYDHIDVDAILKSSRLLKSYMRCVLDQGPCTREGQELRKNLPDAIQTDCAKCSKKQKQWAGKVMAWLLQNEKTYWKQLLDRYDPEGNFQRRFNLKDDDDLDSDDDDDEY